VFAYCIETDESRDVHFENICLGYTFYLFYLYAIRYPYELLMRQPMSSTIQAKYLTIGHFLNIVDTFLKHTKLLEIIQMYRIDCCCMCLHNVYYLY
jgi:hypothetical protein